MVDAKPIAVCGAGIAGTAVASLLAEAGHDVTLFEQAPQCRPVGAGILLQPTGQQALVRLGLLEPVRATSARIERLHAQTARGRQLTYLPYHELGPDVHALGVHRGRLFECLLARCHQRGVRVVTTARIVAREPRAAGVHVLSEEGIDFGPFAFVVAADGSKSALRSASQLRRWVRPYQHAALWTVSKNREVRDELFQVVEGTRTLLGLLPTGEDECSFFWGLTATEWEHLSRGSLDAWKERVTQFCPQAAASLAGIDSWEPFTFATYRQVWMPKWYDDVTVYVGDAAHAMSPHLGQGVNFALLDALALADALAEHGNGARAFSAYQRQRRPHTLFYWWLTRSLTPFFQSDLPPLGWGRDRVLPWMPRVPWLRKQMLRSMSGLKQGWLRA